MKNRKLLLAGSALLLCFSCYYDEYPEKVIPDVDPETPISFSTDIEPGLQKCTGCHNGSFHPMDLRTGNAYNSIVPNRVVAGNAEASRFYQYLPGLPGTEHPNVDVVLSSVEIANIKAWIDRGAENN